MRLEGKVALITGAGKGRSIGKATALLFAREGAKVVIGDILEEEGADTLSELRTNGGEGIFTKLDVTKQEDWQQAVDLTLSQFGKIDVLANIAGIQIPRPSLQEVTLDDWERIMAVNATGMFLGTKAVMEPMKRNGGGSIVNMCSMSGIVGISSNAGYAASKGAGRAFTKYAAIQLAKFGIRVNAVSPGGVATTLIDPPPGAPPDPEKLRRAVERHPLGRIGQPEEIAHAVLYLASDESSFTTGTEMIVDGGFTAQ